MKLINSVKNLICDKVYAAIVLISAMAGYGYELTHCSYGVDDVIYDWYIDTGRLVSMGRFTPWFINKFFKISEFTPFIVDFFGVILFILAGTVICAVLQDILKLEQSKYWLYAVFTALMILYPMNGEVFIYYMHNGMCTAFFLSSLALYFTYRVKNNHVKERLLSDFIALIFIVFAICCYESFIIVLMTLGVLVSLTESIAGTKHNIKELGSWIISLVVVVGLAAVLRSIITKILCGVMGLEVYQTSGGEIGWQFGENVGEIGRTLKNQLMSNYLFYGAGYFPITLFLFAVLSLLIILAVYSWKNKDIWPIILGIFLLIGQFSISILIGMMQLYRMSQSIVVLVAFSIFALILILSKYKAGQIVAIVLSAMLLYTSALEICRLYVFEYGMSDRCADKVKTIGEYLESNYDLDKKKVVFIGKFERSIEEDDYLYISAGEPGYKFLNWCDIHVYGYDPMVVAAGRFYKIETVTDGDVLTWSVNAYGYHNWATQKLFGHYGYDIKITDSIEEYNSVVDDFNSENEDCDECIVEFGDYIIVVLGREEI